MQSPAGTVSIAQSGIDYVVNDVFMPKLTNLLSDLEIPDQKITKGLCDMNVHCARVYVSINQTVSFLQQ